MVLNDLDNFEWSRSIAFETIKNDLEQEETTTKTETYIII